LIFLGRDIMQAPRHREGGIERCKRLLLSLVSHSFLARCLGACTCIRSSGKADSHHAPDKRSHHTARTFRHEVPRETSALAACLDCYD
jgi:hypothetical protein